METEYLSMQCKSTHSLNGSLCFQDHVLNIQRVYWNVSISINHTYSFRAETEQYIIFNSNAKSIRSLNIGSSFLRSYCLTSDFILVSVANLTFYTSNKERGGVVSVFVFRKIDYRYLLSCNCFEFYKMCNCFWCFT